MAALDAREARSSLQWCLRGPAYLDARSMQGDAGLGGAGLSNYKSPRFLINTDAVDTRDGKRVTPIGSNDPKAKSATEALGMVPGEGNVLSRAESRAQLRKGSIWFRVLASRVLHDGFGSGGGVVLPICVLPPVSNHCFCSLGIRALAVRRSSLPLSVHDLVLGFLDVVWLMLFVFSYYARSLVRWAIDYVVVGGSLDHGGRRNCYGFRLLCHTSEVPIISLVCIPSSGFPVILIAPLFPHGTVGLQVPSPVVRLLARLSSLVSRITGQTSAHVGPPAHSCLAFPVISDFQHVLRPDCPRTYGSTLSGSEFAIGSCFVLIRLASSSGSPPDVASFPCLLLPSHERADLAFRLGMMGFLLRHPTATVTMLFPLTP
ncbi:hypothetical protein R1flu_020677 [Riccia fluitans]|uniref:Uncharacterized protein n=1 Tax=Riccia fluitans TaxID=41844 RepID=A0ABD1ZQW5_9MARC